MRFLNFDLSEPSFSIELIGLDFTWDLHNSRIFLGLNMNAADNTSVMRWKFERRATVKYFGLHPVSKYSGCKLVFTDLKLMMVSRRDEELPLSEDDCVSGISKVIPEPAEEPAYRMRQHWNPSDPFHLLFQFQSQRSIEIDAETVELVGVTNSGFEEAAKGRSDDPAL